MRIVKVTLVATILMCIIAVSIITGVYAAWNNNPDPTPEQAPTTPPENDPIIEPEEPAKNILVLGKTELEVGILVGDSIKKIDKDTAMFGDNLGWTPGQIKMISLGMTNNGDADVDFSIGINVIDEKAAVNTAGEEFYLSDYIQFALIKGTDIFAGEVVGVHNIGADYISAGPIKAESNLEIYTLALTIPEDVAQKVAVAEGGEAPDIELGLIVLATTPYGPSLDDMEEEVETPTVPEYFEGSESVENIVVDGVISEPVTIGGGENSSMSAVVPEGVKLEEGVTELTFSVTGVEESEANVELEEGEVKVSFDVHIAGIAADNTVPMEIKLSSIARKGLNNGNIKLYHVENSETVEMTQVALSDEFTAHNQFKYDAATGDLVLYMASFSEVAMVAENDGHWHGTVATSFNKGTGTEADPYIISNADELAFFRDVVDGIAEWSGDRSFKDQYVKLANDVILNHHGETSNQFDPIGWGYDNAAYNRNSAAGKVFMGTFDGDGHGIHGLWQNGWDLEAKTGTDYTYTNCGFGLFAAVKDATIKNLTIKHANVVVECVEAGILVGLAQGNCTFENIMIYESQIANYQRPAGGVVGEVSPGFENGVAQESTVTFDNVHVGSSCTVGSLWGDFDAPVGGVIGAYWDDSGKTKVNMTDVDVSCVLDVYNDVTSAYQWYAYRRAGMLIGNTDRVDPNDSHKAAAPYLTCENCVVVYDDWRNYTYCEFTNENNPGKRYPWVRVEPSQYNSSYSNPRYGHPIDAAGNKVIDDIHLHDVDDECTTLIQFNQLYGGGQGVYGQSTHAGVTEGKYTITFIGADGDIVDVKYVTDNSSAVSLEGLIPEVKNAKNELPLRWEDAQGKVYATYNGSSNTWTYDNTINAGNLVDMVFYPEWAGEFNIYFLDHNGKVLHYEIFTEGSDHNLNFDAIEAQRLAIQKELDHTEKVIQVKWKVGSTVIDDIKNYTFNFASAADDITVNIELALSSQSITLTPHYDDTTNQLINYTVSKVNADDTNKSINIPSHVGHVPVTEITEGAFDGFDNLTAVKIPTTISALGSGMFPGSRFSKQTVTLYYDGTKAEWDALASASGTSWYDTLGDGSRVFFLDKNGKVDISKGYYELYKKNLFSGVAWVYHDHEYLSTAPSGCVAAGHYKGFTDYDAEGRPDIGYWTWIVTYDYNDSATDETIVYVERGDGKTVTLPVKPTRDGYTFVGWRDGTTTYDPDEVVTVSADVTFTAQWEANSAE